MNIAVDARNFFFFSRDTMNALADKLKADYRDAKPFPHVVIDNFLPDDFAARIGQAFPGIQDIDWVLSGPGDVKHTSDPKVEKVATGDEEKFPPLIRLMMMQFQSGIFCEFLNRLTGHEHLIPDPNHTGCGLHSTGNGGRLLMHLDASRHPNKDLNQLINCIYYCTPNWQESYGGALELWNEDASECVTKVQPLFNRLAIFKVSGKSWHGHPLPIQCPPTIRRNSLALYYYSTDKTEYEHTKFVRWKSTSAEDKLSPAHMAKAVLRSTLPTPAMNAIANIARAADSNSRKVAKAALRSTLPESTFNDIKNYIRKRRSKG